LNFKIDGKIIPVLLNVNERKGLYEAVVVKINTRNEYEKQLMTAKKNAERIQKETDLANEELLILLRDVKNKKEQLEQLNHELKTLAEHDELTGLLNRRAFGRHLNFVFEEAYHNN